MIIDCHVHIAPGGKWFSTNFDASVNRLLREMDAAGIDMSVVLPLAGYIDNEYVISVCAQHKSRLIPAGSLNPLMIPEGCESQRIQELYSQGVRALKLHPRLNGYQPLDDACLRLLKAVAHAPVHLPVWMDSLLFSPHVILPKDPVVLLHELAVRNPDVTFVYAHAAGCDAHRLAEAIRFCPNANIDMSYTIARFTSATARESLRHICNTLDRKLLFGSDFPEAPLRQTVEAYTSLCVDIDYEKLLNIFYRNAQKILNS